MAKRLAGWCHIPSARLLRSSYGLEPADPVVVEPTEIVAALVVGVGIGIIVDNYFNTRPFGLIIFFILGSLAGILNVERCKSVSIL